MSPVIIRKDVRLVRVGERFQLEGREREVVSVRRVMITTTPANDDGFAHTISGRELLHKSPHKAGVDYLVLPNGALVATLVL